MRIELRDENRQRIGGISVEAALRPTRVSVVNRSAASSHLQQKLASVVNGQARAPAGEDSARPEIPPREVFLNWDSAVDDAGQLRRCVACSCPDLFRERAFPQVTGFVVILAFVGAVVGALGLATNLPVLLTMACVLVLDVAILVFSRRRLVCYRCRTSYHNLPIARYHRPWDRSMADRYPVVASPVAATAAHPAVPPPIGATPHRGSLA